MTTTTNDVATDKPAFRFHPKLWIGAAMLFAFPALGTVMSPEVNWGAEDFAAMAVLLGGVCAAIEAALHFLDAPRWRIGMIVLAVLMALTVWAHLAVGVLD
jgi:cobalamin biosynthesis protein CobD/CbiB